MAGEVTSLHVSFSLWFCFSELSRSFFKQVVFRRTPSHPDDKIKFGVSRFRDASRVLFHS